jgi:hypothetical protein
MSTFRFTYASSHVYRTEGERWFCDVLYIGERYMVVILKGSTLKFYNESPLNGNPPALILRGTRARVTFF